MVVINEFPVRQGAATPIGPYTFKDSDDVAMDLTGYTTVHCLLKLKGALYSTLTGAIVSAAAGTVHVATAYQFPTAGVWMAQFVLDRGLTSEWPGNPLRFQVVENVDDASLDEILRD